MTSIGLAVLALFVCGAAWLMKNSSWTQNRARAHIHPCVVDSRRREHAGRHVFSRRALSDRACRPCVVFGVPAAIAWVSRPGDGCGERTLGAQFGCMKRSAAPLAAPPTTQGMLRRPGPWRWLPRSRSPGRSGLQCPTTWCWRGGWALRLQLLDGRHPRPCARGRTRRFPRRRSILQHGARLVLLSVFMADLTRSRRALSREALVSEREFRHVADGQLLYVVLVLAPARRSR